jgi:hypothetical protein
VASTALNRDRSLHAGGNAERQREDHRLAVDTSLGHCLVARGVVCPGPQEIGPGREHRVINPRHQAIPLVVRDERLPDTGSFAADLDRSAGDAGERVGRLNRDLRRIRSR